MSESSELDEIRERKLEELKQSVGADATEDESTDTVPTEPIHISGQSHLQETTNTYDVVLVDFHADWCGPCQMLEPIIEELAAEADAAVAKVDVDAQQALAMQYQVRGVPTVMVFADGEAVERLSGVREKRFYEQLIAQYTN